MSKATIFIVEDEAIVAADLAGKLKQLGYEVCGSAGLGEEALKRVRSLHPDLVLMDIRLAGEMDGVETAELVRREFEIPVIFLTAHSDRSTLERAKATEPFGYLLKPFDARGLEIHIEMALYKHRAEESLRASEEQFRRAIEDAPVPVLLCAEDGEVLQVSRSWGDVTGYPRDEMPPVEVWLRTSLPAEAAATVRDQLRELFEGTRRGLRAEFPVVTRSGRSRYWDFSASSPGILKDGRRLAVAMGLDLTDRMREQEELRQAKQAAEAASRTKSRFLANMSHELRTPMSGVLGMLDLALQSPSDPQQKEYLETARRSCRSLLGILNDILDLSKAEAGKFTLAQHPFELRSCLTETAEIVLPEVRRKGLALDLQLAEELPQRVVGDQVRLRQVLTNLVGNAVKFTDRGGVTVEVGRGAEVAGGVELRFSVRDTGIGIPLAQRDLLFRSFSQLDDTDSRSYGGTGLGLAVSRELVELMGGRIECESAKGEGSVFSFTVRVGRCDEEPSAPDESEPAPAPLPERVSGALCPVRLLVAEDDPTIRQILAAMLEKLSYRVQFADDGEAAVRMWREGGYDLILMDVQMPRVDGFQATRIIREEEGLSGAHVPIIAMTAHAMKEDEARCVAAGMDGYLSKPVDFRRCLEMIEALTGG